MTRLLRKAVSGIEKLPESMAAEALADHAAGRTKPP